MPNKFHRQNLRMGSNPFGKKSNLQKIAETFGPKKKVKKDKKPKKRMFANKGGGADTGRMGEIKSQATLAADQIRRLYEKMEPGGRMSERDLKMIKKMMGNKKLNLPNTPPPTINSAMKFLKKMEPDNPRFSEKDIKLAKNALGMKKGGLAKKKKKFPDISGDGKVTMKDVLMARGVIPKNKKDKKKVI